MNAPKGRHGAPSARDVAEQLGLKRYPHSWRGNCPACSYAGTFSVKAASNGSARMFCANCQDREAIRQAVGAGRSAEPNLSSGPGMAAHQAQARAKRLAAAEKCLTGAVQAIGTPAAAYLSSRGIGAAAKAASLRWRTDLSHPEQGGHWPGMVAEVIACDGSFLGVHRTYLRPDGCAKADIVPDKATLGPIWSGAVRIGQSLPTADRPQLVIGEGIESSASAGIVLGLPAWAALSAGNLRMGLVLPEEIRSLVIAADNDQAGITAASEAMKRWRTEGRTVEIALPDAPGEDFNDVLMRRASHG